MIAAGYLRADLKVGPYTALQVGPCTDLQVAPGIGVRGS